MPPVIGAVVSGIAAAASGATFLGLSGAALGALVAGSSLVLSGVSKALAPKRKNQAIEFGKFGQERTVTLRQPIAAWSVLYGEVRTGGTITYLQSTSANKFLHMVITLTGHEVDSIGQLWFGDEVVPLDGGGFATGKYAGLVRVKKALGTAAQAAHADLVAESGGKWTANHRQQGRSNIYVRLQWNADLFSGFDLSKIMAVVRGRKVFDPRTGQTVWTSNPALCIADYLANATFGLGAAYGTEINQAALIDAANICDEMVPTASHVRSFTADPALDTLKLGAKSVILTGDKVQVSSTGALPGGLSPVTDYYAIDAEDANAGEETIKLATSLANARAGVAIDITSAGSGTHTVTRLAEPRYTMNGTFSTQEHPKDVIEGMLPAMAGRAALRGGVWSLYAGAYIPPTVTLAEGDVRGRIKASTRLSRRESFNAVKGVYVDPLTWQTTDFPPVTNATYLAEDNSERVWKDIELRYTLSPSMAQRLAKIELERARQEITVELPCKLTAYRVQPPETVMVTNARRGWTNKPFEVVSSRLTMEDAGGAPAFAVDLTLRETAAAVYDWNSGLETTVDPAPNSDLPNPFAVAAPTNLALSSGTAELDVRLDGTVFSRVKASWIAPADEFVLSGGQIEIEFKRSAEGTWRPWGSVRGDQTLAFILDVQDGVAYDVRIRAVNSLGVKGAWISASNHTVVGKSAPPPDVPLLLIENNILRWTYPNPPLDLAGFRVRHRAGARLSWADATPAHDGLIAGTTFMLAALPSGTRAILVKAEDTSGNQSANAAFVVQDLGDPIVANVLKRDDRAAAGFPDTITGGAVAGGKLSASTNTPFWAADDKALFWAADQAVQFWNAVWKEMIYLAPFTPEYADVPSDLSLDAAVAGSPFEIDYRSGGDGRFWPTPDAAPFWAADGLSFWPAEPGFASWPGKLAVSRQKYEVRVRTGAGTTQGQISAFAFVLDVPDLVERLNDVAIAAAGTRLPIANIYRKIANVQLTLQFDGGTAIRAETIDKNVAGPLVKTFDGAGLSVAGLVDATVQGY